MSIREGRDYPIGGKPGDRFDNFSGFIDDMQDKTMPSPPGYQQPPGQQPQQPQQGYQQYYQQMRESMSGMDRALKELEGMQMPGGQYKPNDEFDANMFTTNYGSAGK
jgi:hypothetical protein